MRRSLAVAWTVAVALGLMAVGCGGGGGDNLPREPVSGKIKIDGQPLQDGAISFIHNDGTGPAASTKIEKGDYLIVRANGPVPGPYRVVIYSPQPTGKKIAEEDLYAETIPGRYNAKSQLKVDIKAGGDNNFDFELTGRMDPTKVNREGGRTQSRWKGR
jgi:hypothetical protein